MDVSDDLLERLLAEAMDELPEERIEGLDNVAIVFEDSPTAEQHEKLKLRGNQTLFGLYEGIPLTKRGAGYNLVLPDKITIFRRPILEASSSMADLKEKIKHTLWHEIAHYYGLDHERIHALEEKHRG
jgi:predicted Zn-dependent protease with MMP-like domain